MNKQLVKGFMKNAKVLLRRKGEIHISHKVGGPYNKWKLMKKTAKIGLILHECVAFRKDKYPSYGNKRAHGNSADLPFYLGECNTYKFKLKIIKYVERGMGVVSLTISNAATEAGSHIVIDAEALSTLPYRTMSVEGTSQDGIEEQSRLPNSYFGSIFSTLLPRTMAKLEPPEGCTFLDGLDISLLLFKPALLYIRDELVELKATTILQKHVQNLSKTKAEGGNKKEVEKEAMELLPITGEVLNTGRELEEMPKVRVKQPISESFGTYFHQAENVSAQPAAGVGMSGHADIDE
ncbi:hypothetical protein GIB67_019862 [Kingdonia uniflora]|uniref:25S rRNA (uridine-N(3))-methyltransferase BMT5-like domain-containing protein n=1 Tax=Kingdonia uniflora TaxID=39325 RepID=A0A7J7MKD1_9MAGN|nr:hypothetical protein GIB67_019862 [Kingdonia uniflora]